MWGHYLPVVDLSTSLLLPVNTSLSSSSLTMVEQLLGSYDLDRNENFEEFLAATGVPLIARKMMVSVSPKITIAKEEDRITITFKILIKSFPLTFELGKEFTEDNPISGEKNKVWRERMNLALLALFVSLSLQPFKLCDLCLSY